MKFPKSYKILKQNTFSSGLFSIVPIRYEDRISIMNWRNEQLYHLRQNQILTIADQDEYYETVVANSFDTKRPDQLLFSFLEKGICVAYGGLVHINWKDLNAEISFVIDTNLERDCFSQYWNEYLRLIEKVAFNEINFRKIYTYAFDLRPHLYKAVELAGFKKEAKLKDHCRIDDVFYDVIIHSKFNHKQA